jgi:hypothetical protein
MTVITDPALRCPQATQRTAQGCGCAAADVLSAASQARLRHLFRALTRVGRVHPLHHLMLRYRAGEGRE